MIPDATDGACRESADPVRDLHARDDGPEALSETFERTADGG